MSKDSDNLLFPSKKVQWKRWEMEAFDTVSPQPIRPDTAPAATDTIPDAATLLSEIEEAKRRATRQGYDAGYAQGYAEGQKKGKEEGFTAAQEDGFNQGLEQGTAEGYAKGAEQAKQESERLANLVEASHLALHRTHEEMGQALLDLAVTIASHVLQSTLEREPERLLDLIQQLLHIDPDGKNPLTLFLHPNDVELVHTYIKTNDATHNWRIIEDATISAGGCKARTAYGDIDATLETRWRRAISTLKLDSKHLITPSLLVSPSETGGSSD
ncbi:MAG TPA: flagellar assembly protein FliH [Paenalcaligenes sp.]|nr:flagellar assembly protein FliH [Paenalcaligenes sp.]